MDMEYNKKIKFAFAIFLPLIFFTSLALAQTCKVSITSDYDEKADLNENGSVDKEDVSLLIQYFLCEIDTFPVCEASIDNPPSGTLGVVV
jgi:hypothetical protein